MKFILTEAITNTWADAFADAGKNGSTEYLGNFLTYNELWETWFKEVLPNADISKCKELIETFSEEQKLGYTAETNPFIKWINDNVSLFNNSVTKFGYNALHNAFIRKYINNKDLLGTGILKKENLIFNKAIYEKLPLDILEYLRIQAFLEDKIIADDSFVFTGTIDEVKKLNSFYPNINTNLSEKIRLINNIFFGSIYSNSQTSKENLHELPAIKDVIKNNINGNITKHKKDATDLDIKDIIENVDDEFADGKEKLLKLLLTSTNWSEDQQNTINKFISKNDLAYLNNINITVEEGQELRKKFLSNIKLSAIKLENLLNGLLISR